MSGRRAKQRLKNGVYRAVGEAASALGAARESGRTLRVLMYHKVDGRPGNSLAVPPRLFAEQMEHLRARGYAVVSLDAVLSFYREGTALPPRAVLLTFDDGYRDNLEHALPTLRAYGFPAVLFVPAGFVGSSRPLPHDEPLAARGLANPTLDWDELGELERGGVRVESHGVSHRPLAQLDDAEAAREVEESKALLEERLGRPVRAFAYVKGGASHFGPRDVELVRRAGYELAFATRTGANGPGADPLRLRRYNVEPFPMRTFELLLAGACDLLAVKDTKAGARAKKALDTVFGTSTS